jgi:hypothetical protein
MMEKENEQIKANYRHRASVQQPLAADSAAAPASGKNRNANAPFQSYGSYLFSNFEDPGTSGFDENKAHPWSSYTIPRMSIRVFSRGLLGATFYTIANRWIPGQLAGYSASKAITMETVMHQPGQVVARAFDLAYGKPIQWIVRGFYKTQGKAGAELEELVANSVRFRGKKDFGDPDGMGRSLGAEVFGMTADFAAGSVGDATGRKIAAIFDPNDPNSWENEDGSVDAKKFAKAFARDAWQIVSLNQGEDWAAALPYVYQMRWQRQAINRLYKGFKATSDFQLNGGSFRLDGEGRIVDSYAKAGALDLQLRFTGYNWYTLMYRDAYNELKNWAKGYQAEKDEAETRQPDTVSGNPLVGAVEEAAHLVRYVAKSAVKATIYMTPAVPFFWASRTPQTKYKGIGLYLDDRMGIAKMPNGQPFSYFNMNEAFKADAGKAHYPLTHGEPLLAGHNPQYSLKAAAFGPNFDPFAREHTRGVLDRTLNPVGRFCYNTADKSYNMMRKAGINVHKAAVHDWVNASISYTPYMIAKAETALRWDRPKDSSGLNDMDRAIYRMLDGVASLNPGEVRAGFRDIGEEIIHPDSTREIEENIARNSQQEQNGKQEKPDTRVTSGVISTDIAVAPKKTTAAAPEKEEGKDWRYRKAREDFVKDLDSGDRVLH